MSMEIQNFYRNNVWFLLADFYDSKNLQSIDCLAALFTFSVPETKSKNHLFFLIRISVYLNLRLPEMISAQTW